MREASGGGTVRSFAPPGTKRCAHLEEVCQVLEDPDAHLVQVLQEAVKDRQQVAVRDLLPLDQRHLVDGEGQSPTHLPLGQTASSQVV